MWSVGCIFAELTLKQPLFQAKGGIEMISVIFKLLGPPGQDLWPDYYTLPLAKTISLPPFQPPQFLQKFRFISDSGTDLWMKFLTYDLEYRITAEEALEHPYFKCMFLLLV